MSKDTSSNTKTEKASAKPPESKGATEAKSTEAKDTESKELSGRGAKQPARPVSFFSSVRTDEYRSGWDSVFGKSTKRDRPRHFEVSLSYDELSTRERKLLLEAFRRKALLSDIDPDSLANSASIDWRLSCRFEA
jgi:hypothetical protein